MAIFAVQALLFGDVLKQCLFSWVCFLFPIKVLSCRCYKAQAAWPKRFVPGNSHIKSNRTPSTCKTAVRHIPTEHHVITFKWDLQAPGVSEKHKLITPIIIISVSYGYEEEKQAHC